MLAKPALTLPPEAAAYLRENLQKANVYFEYGSGGSTVMATDLNVQTVVTVESDQAWLENLNAYIQSTGTRTRLVPLHSDIGPTKEWGHPVNEEKWRQFPAYPFKVWEYAAATKLEPDLILIDGRFRIGCFIASMLNVKRKTILLFDDYKDRPSYHFVEKYCKPIEMVDRMAVFKLERVEIRNEDFLELLTKTHELL